MLAYSSAHAARVSHVAVDTGNLAVVTIVEGKAVHILVHGVEDEDLNARCAQGVDRFAGKALDVAEIVENNLDLDPRARLGAEDRFQLIPELALGQNEVFKENEALGPCRAVDEVAQQRRAVGEIRRLRVLIETEAAAGQKVCRARPCRHLARELIHSDLAAGAHTLRLVRRALGGTGQAALLRGAAPQKPQDQPRHRRQ